MRTQQRSKIVEGRRSIREERGQTLVLFALALIAVIGIIALAVDGGYAYVQRRRMQYAADAAALAGARAMLTTHSLREVDRAVRRYARRNGASTYSWSHRGTSRIQVQVSTTFPTFFASVVGLSSMTARARSEAEASGVSAVRNALPIGIRVFPFRFNQTYTFYRRHHGFGPGPEFDWLDWNGGSRSVHELAYYICNPRRSGLQRIHRWVWNVPGVYPSAYLRYCLNRRLGQVIIVPLYNMTTGHGVMTRHYIIGFAAFYFEGYRLWGPISYIRGRFIRRVVSGTGGGPDYGLITVRLGEN